MFSTPRQRPGPLIAHQLQALEKYRLSMGYEPVKPHGNAHARNAAARQDQLHAYLRKHQGGSVAAICEALGFTRDEFRTAASKLVKARAITYVNRGYYEVL